MKPFAEVVGDRGVVWGLVVGGCPIGAGVSSSRSYSLEDDRDAINAAFESRLKEEMEKFRERVIEVARSKSPKQRVGSIRQLAIDDVLIGIRAMPLFETEEKP